MPSLSVVVCTHNGAEKLPIALASLIAQDAEAFELLVIDDGSGDASRQVARAAGVRVARLEDNAGLAAARNWGLAQTSGEIVAFTDDDCSVATDWARQIVRAFRDEPKLAGVSGPVIPASSDPFMSQFLLANNPLKPLGAELLASNGLRYRLGLYLRRVLLRRTPLLDELYSVVGANMAFRRSALIDVDGFDEAFRFGSEEEDLCRRLHARPGGALLRYVAGATVTHWFEGGVRDTLRRSGAYGRGNARMVLKHPTMRPVVFPGPVVICALMASAIRARRLRPLALAQAVLFGLYPSWVGPVLRGSQLRAVAFPYVQFAQEVAVMLGEVSGARVGYTRVAARHLEDTGNPTDGGRSAGE
jgi:GT2 family glycosyltransferase